MNRIRKRLTYANVMSSLAVFLVLGGGAAFAALGKNTVGTKQLKKNAVTTPKIKNGAVTTPKLASGAVTTGQLANGSVTNEKIADNSVSTSKVVNGAINGDKLGNDSVTGAKIAAGSVGRDDIANSNLIPRGYAFVNFSGEVDPAFSSGIPNASHPSTGVYCFDLAFAPVHAQVTTEGDTEPNDISSVNINGVGEGLVSCPAGNDLEVRGWDTQFNELTSEEFFLVVW